MNRIAHIPRSNSGSLIKGISLNHSRMLASLNTTLKNPTFKTADTEVSLCDAASRKPRPKLGQKITFGQLKSDHMAVVDFDAEDNFGWGKPKIVPYGNLSLSPCYSGLHYGFQVFEGIKAYRSVQDRQHIANIFRLDTHVQRLLGSSVRMSMPAFDVNEMCELIKKLVSIDFDWIPEEQYSSLYIRPLLFGTEDSFGLKAPNKVKLVVFSGPVSSYYDSEGNFGDFSKIRSELNLLASPQYIRAWPGGVGAYKTGCNYGPTASIQRYAQEKYNASQILWLYENKITEVGSMNIFVSFLKNGKRVLATPSLQQGIILPGVTRKTIIELCHRMDLVEEVQERDIYFEEVVDLLKNPDENNKVLGIFGSGTAAIVSPVNGLIVTGEDGAVDKYTFPVDVSLCNTLFNIITSLQRCTPVDKLDKAYIDSLSFQVRRHA